MSEHRPFATYLFLNIGFKPTKANLSFVFYLTFLKGDSAKSGLWICKDVCGEGSLEWAFLMRHLGNYINSFKP